MVEFRVIKSAIFKGKEHVQVDQNTMEQLKEAGFGGHECYKPQNTFNFVAQLLADKETTMKLKGLIPENDNKPIIFMLGGNIGSILTWRSEHKGEFFGGGLWCGALAEFENAWGVYVTNSPR